MARGFRRRRYSRRVFRSRRGSRSMRRRMLIRKRVKRFVNKMGYPSYVKMIGMTESKKLLLRKTLMLDAPYSSITNKKTNVFQIVLNPLECPNIEKAFTALRVGNEGIRTFKYDYIRIKSIFISIKPAQSISTTNGADANSLYANDGDGPVSNVYAYFTYKFPMVKGNDVWDANIQPMYGTNPIAERIVSEGKLKNTYSWPCNKPMTISLNKLYYRINNEPYRLCSNSPLDLQFLSTLAAKSNSVYDPFEFGSAPAVGPDEKKHTETDNYDDSNELGLTPENDGLQITIPDVDMAKEYNMFFGRLVIVAPKQVRFTTEICYDCVLIR